MGSLAVTVQLSVGTLFPNLLCNLVQKFVTSLSLLLQRRLVQKVDGSTSSSVLGTVVALRVKELLGETTYWRLHNSTINTSSRAARLCQGTSGVYTLCSLTLLASYEAIVECYQKKKKSFASWHVLRDWQLSAETFIRHIGRLAYLIIILIFHFSAWVLDPALPWSFRVS